MALKPYDTGHSYRTSNWLTHYAVATAVVLGLICLGLIGLLIAILPLKEVQPFLVSSHDKSTQVVLVEPLKVSKKAETMLMESLARQYVMYREPIDLQTEDHRWEKVILFSSAPLARSFYEHYKRENSESPLRKFESKGVTRSVIIHASTSLAPSAPNVWQVEWESIDYKDNREIGRSRWVSTLTADLAKREVSYEEQYLNPVGFRVTNYRVSKKG